MSDPSILIVAMIRQILPIVVAACIAPCFAAEGWLTDMDAAKKEAAEQKKDLMIEFTGSDWCPPCMQLRANVFSKPDFQKEAQKNFVLLELDYPRGKEQSAEMKAANQKLAEQYGVTGFPTVVFADASGKSFGVLWGNAQGRRYKSHAEQGSPPGGGNLRCEGFHG